MSRWLALVENPLKHTESVPDNLTKPDKSPGDCEIIDFCHVLSGCQVGSSMKNRRPAQVNPGKAKAGHVDIRAVT